MSEQDRLIYIGFTYGIMGSFSFSALFINLITILLYGKSKVNLLMIFMELCSIIRATMILYMIPHEYEGWNSISRNILAAIQTGILTYYPLMRCGKILGRRMQKLGHISPYLLKVGVFVREVENDGVFDSEIPFYGFVLTALYAYSLSVFALITVGRKIRDNPAGKLDRKQVRLRQISDFMVISAGAIQFCAMACALLPIRYFVNPLLGLTSLVFALSEMLMVFNKNLPDLNNTIHISQITMEPMIKHSLK